LSAACATCEVEPQISLAFAAGRTPHTQTIGPFPTAFDIQNAMSNLFANFKLVQDQNSLEEKASNGTPTIMEKLPTEEDRVLTMTMEKRVTAGTLLWQERDLVITNSALIFARPGISKRNSK
jgi:hypothetical protein